MGVAIMERGKVRGRSIIFPKPLSLPEGTEVVVQIRPFVSTTTPIDSVDTEQFRSLPFFGMWAHREDMQDSVAWVRKEREKWQQRATRQD